MPTFEKGNETHKAGATHFTEEGLAGNGVRCRRETVSNGCRSPKRVRSEGSYEGRLTILNSTPIQIMNRASSANEMNPFLLSRRPGDCKLSN